MAVIAVLSGACGGDGSSSSTPTSPSSTGLPVAGRTPDVVDQQNQRSAQLEQQVPGGP
jgi:hypothetical protein